LFVSISQVIGCEDRLRNDLYCVGWGVKLYSNQTEHLPLPKSICPWLGLWLWLGMGRVAHVLHCKSRDQLCTSTGCPCSFLYIDMCALHSVPWMFVTLISINGVPVFQYL